MFRTSSRFRRQLATNGIRVVHSTVSITPVIAAGWPPVSTARGASALGVILSGSSSPSSPSSPSNPSWRKSVPSASSGTSCSASKPIGAFPNDPFQTSRPPSISAMVAAEASEPASNVGASR